MKKIILTAFISCFLALSSSASVYIRYFNKDAKDYKFSVNIGGTMKTIEFGSSRSASVVVAGVGSDCVINSLCGQIKVSTNSKIIIENGCITIQYSGNEKK